MNYLQMVHEHSSFDLRIKLAPEQEAEDNKILAMRQQGCWVLGANSPVYSDCDAEAFRFYSCWKGFPSLEALRAFYLKEVYYAPEDSYDPEIGYNIYAPEGYEGDYPRDAWLLNPALWESWVANRAPLANGYAPPPPPPVEGIDDDLPF